MSAELEPDPARYLDVMRGAFAAHYREGSDVWTPDPEMRVVPALIHGRLKLPATTHVLDLGCGAGCDVEYFSQLYERVEGIDLVAHPAWPAIAARRPNVELREHDVLADTSTARFGLVFDNGCFHHQHPTRYAAYLARVARWLAPAGWYVLSTFKNATRDKHVDAKGRLHRYFTDAELHAELAHAQLETVDELDVWRARCGDFYRLTYCQLRA